MLSKLENPPWPTCGREFPIFNLTFKSLNTMKPSPQSRGFMYESQMPSAVSYQRQQPSEWGYEGRTGKAINCQSLHRSTSQSTTTINRHPHPPQSALPQPPNPRYSLMHVNFLTYSFIRICLVMSVREGISLRLGYFLNWDFFNYRWSSSNCPVLNPSTCTIPKKSFSLKHFQ